MIVIYYKGTKYYEIEADMSYQFNINEMYEPFFFKKKTKDNLILPDNLGSMTTYRNVISKDISLVKANMNSNEDLSILVDSIADTPSMFINIVLQDGAFKYDYLTGEEDTYDKKDIVIEYKNRSKYLIKINKNTATKDVGIMIKNSFLEENLFCYLKDEKRREIEKNCKDNMATLFKSSLMSRKIIILAKDIYKSPFIGQLQKVYLQSRVYEIIYEEFMSIISDNDKESVNKIILSQDDIDALDTAKAIISENMESLCISELAKKVAINEKKLNYGFKKLFGTTPGNMMLENRMYKAKKLLEESEYNINEVAEITGYKYAQNFTNAFIKFFGKKPSDIMKSRSYYY